LTLWKVGAFDEDGTIHWDVGMVCFGLASTLTRFFQVSTGGNPQQETVNKITPSFSQGCFFFPLPAGVLMYMLIANIFQTLKHLLSPANLCRKICKKSWRQPRKE